MPISTQTNNNDAVEVRSFEVTICQIREDHHVYYSASVQSLGRAAQAYGHSPEAALAKLYDEVIPRVAGIKGPGGRATVSTISSDQFANRQFRGR